ncbi:MAG TPA: deoxynucleoside kinase [Aggregatilinea sp.]|jgi:deoxyguanosine kinase|uniref:deoxynucleoside kinase n=1 Tax=Aggregatilinea sp. TaxID=2806333 RepID=UPI002D008B18|nr:deoxynucleoside kinase [Aggregatilinea sp.]HML21784.1 deoxynucleoside kinase [Aggregatilinea sp.]
MLVLLEGNIAAGKSTLGVALAQSAHFQFVPEPVAHWQTGFAANLLERFYADTPRWAFTMQIGAFVTRAQMAAPPATDGAIAVFERSVYCDRYVFAKNLHDQGTMDETEWAVYCHFWEHFTAAMPAPDAILYLRTPAEECLRRLQIRGRAEEKAIPLAYLQQLEACHDEWLGGPSAHGIPVLTLDGAQAWTADDVAERLAQILPTP